MWHMFRVKGQGHIVDVHWLLKYQYHRGNQGCRILGQCLHFYWMLENSSLCRRPVQIWPKTVQIEHCAALKLQCFAIATYSSYYFLPWYFIPRVLKLANVCPEWWWSGVGDLETINMLAKHTALKCWIATEMRWYNVTHYYIIIVTVSILICRYMQQSGALWHRSVSLNRAQLVADVSLSFIGFTHFLLLSIPSLSTRIVPLCFQAGGCRRRPNLGLVSVLLCNLCYLYSLVKMDSGVLFYLV